MKYPKRGIAEGVTNAEYRELASRIGKTIRKLRLEKGMRPEQLATAAGVSAGHIYQIELGRFVPPLARLIVMAHALGVNLQQLLSPDTISDQSAPPDGLRIALREHGLSTEQIRLVATFVEALRQTED